MVLVEEENKSEDLVKKEDIYMFPVLRRERFEKSRVAVCLFLVNRRSAVEKMNGSLGWRGTVQ